MFFDGVESSSGELTITGESIPDFTYLGRYEAASSLLDGAIKSCYIWNTEPTAADAALLAKYELAGYRRAS